jgi:hypothetical protein
MGQQGSVDCFVAFAPRNDGKIHHRILAARCVRVVQQTSALKQRAQGMPGARCARSLVCSVWVAHECSHHGHTGNTRHSPRNGFTAYIVLSRVTGPVTGLSCHPRRRSCLHQLDSSVGASGPHDFAVRRQAFSSATPPASTASRTHVRDDRETPLGWDGTVRNLPLIWGRDQRRRPAADWHDGQNDSPGVAVEIVSSLLPASTIRAVNKRSESGMTLTSNPRRSSAKIEVVAARATMQ